MAFGTTVWNTVTISLRQRIVPAHLLGRVNSVYRWLVWGSISVGSALGGVTAREFGLRAPFFFGAAFGAVALVTLFFSITAGDITSLAAQPRVAAGSDATDDTPIEIDSFPWPEQFR
jgi:predicted MFS family arabinose efflux permease